VLKYFFGLHIKSLINLKIVSAAFGIEGAIARIAPWLPACTSASVKALLVSLRKFNI